LKVVLASGNKGKLAELGDLLSQSGIELLPQGALGIADPVEDGHTFVENALIKARNAARLSGLPALADDSGLCCVALGGAPGVRSARFAGEPADDARNNAELLRQLHDAPDRAAHFVCVLVALRAADDPEPLVSVGTWQGEVARAAQGAGGFGYDPLFWLPERACTAAALEPAEKNRISHRAQASRTMLDLMRRQWRW